MGMLDTPCRAAILAGADKLLPSGEMDCPLLLTLVAATSADSADLRPNRGSADRPSIAANIDTPNTTVTISWTDHQKLDCSFSLRRAIVRRSSPSDSVDSE